MNAITQFPPLLDARPARGAHDPRLELRLGIAALAIFGLGFVGWSAVARLDAAVHAPGTIRVAGNRQAVQSQNGGVVTAIGVHEGDHVRAGQLLVDFATAEALGQERSLASRVIGLQAEIARIDAELSGAAHVEAPAEWSVLGPEEKQIATHALTSEENNLIARRELLQSERAVLRERIAQVGSQIGGYQRRRTSNLRQSELNSGELADVSGLFAKGYATKTRVLSLQRSAAAIDGEIGSIDAEIGRLRATEGETRLQILQLADQRDRDNADRLRQAQTELQSLLPQWKAAREQLAQTQARAPVAGTVLELAVNTVGAVAQRGAKLMEIVPDHGALQVEAQVSPSDANDLKTGMRADVHVGGMRGRNLPVLHGIVTRVSADSLTDEKTGRPYFTATVKVQPRDLAAVTREAGLRGTVKPGTPVDVIVPLRPRTAISYWLEPLFARFRPAMTEG